MGDDKKRRRFRFFDDEDDDFFGLFDIEEFIRREFERAMRIMSRILEENMDVNTPMIYGIRITIGPDGVPKIQTFGNVKKALVKGEEVFEPSVDVYEKDDSVQVIVEIPGASKESIKIKAKEDEVYVEASGERKYAKRIKLPTKVDPKSARATFKNGILTITLKKLSKDEGVDVKVEREFFLWSIRGFYA